LLFPKLVEPTCELCELVVSKPWWLGVGSAFRLPGGFDSAVRWRSRAGSTGFALSEAGRVETSCACLGIWGRVLAFRVGGGFDSDRSFLAPRLNQLRGDRVLRRDPQTGRAG